MHVDKTPEGTETEAPAQPAKLSKAQIKFMAKVTEAATNRLNDTIERFIDWFTSVENPEGTEVQERINTLDAQWQVYCNAKRLSDTSKAMLRKYCTAIVEDYSRIKSESFTPQPESGSTPQIQSPRCPSCGYPDLVYPSSKLPEFHPAV